MASLQIDSYEKIYEEVSKLENTKVFHGWLQSDCRPFKHALLNTIRRWSLMFKQHLSDHVINRWVRGGTVGAGQGTPGKQVLQPPPPHHHCFPSLLPPQPRRLGELHESGPGRPEEAHQGG